MHWLSDYSAFFWVASWSTPFWDIFFRTATDLGSHVLYYAVVAALYWVVDRRHAGVLFLLLLVSGYLNTVVKLGLDTPRPSPHVIRVLDLRPYEAGNPAFPSGHAQGAIVFWGFLSWWVRRRWFTVVAAACAALVSFSRIYVGAHFPIDLLGGSVLAVVVLIGATPALLRWSHHNFHLPKTGGVALVAGTILAAMWVHDTTIAVISGSVAGFFIAGVWLPQPKLSVATVRLASLVTAIGIVVMLLTAGLFETLPKTPLAQYAQMIALWIVTLWFYPSAVSLAVPAASVAGAESP